MELNRHYRYKDIWMVNGIFIFVLNKNWKKIKLDNRFYKYRMLAEFWRRC